MSEPYITISVAQPELLDDYCTVFFDSVLFDRYFSDGDRLREWLGGAIERRELLVAKSGDEIVGVMDVMLKGFVGSFPYLALLGVKKGWRSMGVGKQMLQFFEGVARELGSRHIAIMVSSFNPRARNLYQSMGYKRIGMLENALKEGIDENILIKTL